MGTSRTFRLTNHRYKKYRMVMSLIYDSHRTVIDAWPRLSDFATDIGVAYGSAKAMRRRNRIPLEHIHAVVEAARQRSIDGVTAELLVKLAADAASERDEVSAS